MNTMIHTLKKQGRSMALLALIKSILHTNNHEGKILNIKCKDYTKNNEGEQVCKMRKINNGGRVQAKDRKFQNIVHCCNYFCYIIPCIACKNSPTLFINFMF